jgi:Lrp/AsnC family leucine-responsive transcriptional regulator
MTAPLDDKDRLLIAYLRRNARSTTVELARKLGLSRSALQTRMARLERSGVIRGYTVVLGDPSISETLRSWLAVRLDKGASTEVVLERLREVPDVGAAYLLTGEVVILTEVQSLTIAGIEKARLHIASIEGVGEVRSYVVLRAAWPDAPGHVPSLRDERPEPVRAVPQMRIA